MCSSGVRLVLSGAMLAMLTASNLRANDLYEVGVGVVDITPDYPIRLNGFGNRREESEGVSQRIFAKALAIRQSAAVGETREASSQPLVLVTLDSLGIRQSLWQEVARRLHESNQLPPENLAITFSHSHCTPKVNGACDNIFSTAIPEDHQQHIDRYTQELTNYVTQAAQQALSSMTPAHLEWSVGTVKFAKNRRTVGGPVDHDLPMLVVKDAQSGVPRAIYVSYACHCVTLSFNQISGDWAGYAAEMIERQHPGTVALVSIGAGSDQNPISGVTGDKVEIAEAQGLEIAGEVTRLLSEPRKRISGVPTSVNSLIQLPLNELPTREQLIAQTGQGRPTDKYNATTQLAQLDRGQPLLTHINYPIQTWTFGDSFCMTFLAGEVCVDYALRLKQELDRERFWLNTYSNDFCCYIPSERLAVEGGYGGGAEVPYFALPTTLKAGLEQKIIDEVHRQVPTSFHAGDGTQGIAPQAPEESLQCMSVSPGLQVVLAASEPNVTDPVAIDFGPDGRLWVAEMSDYGRDVYESFAQSGKVRWLRDSDNDGHFETAVTFVDGLRFPTDVKVWRDGVLICDAPDILWARDTSGDGKADDVTKLFTGFEVRNAQARVNSLRWGLDNWLYGAGGLFGGTISSLQTRSVVECSNRDFRMNPDSGVIEPVTGNTQQGRCRNDWGEWFGCSNGTLLRPISSDDAYERRNPLAIPSSLPSVVIDADAHQLFPPADLVTFELSGAPGRATSACGLGIYRDTLLGDDFLNDAFTCEPVHQSVHRIDFRPTESGFVGSRAADEEDREFLSSTDRWFRPVQVRTGPDGALWVVDMYRFVIEHSRWIPQSTLSELNVFAGTDRGRIYRVLPSSSGAGAKSSGLIPDWTSLSDDQLADHLETANGIQRDLVHQQLIWRKASGTASKLRTLAAQSRLPAVRLQALAALDGLERLTVDDVKAALHDDESEVQRFSVLLSERWLAKSDSLQQAVAALASTPSVKVRRQVALSLGVVPNDSTAAALAGLMSRSEPNPHVRSAALNSVSVRNAQSILQQVAEAGADTLPNGSWEKLLALCCRLGDAATLQEVFARHLPPVQVVPTGSANRIWTSVLESLDARMQSQPFPEDFRGNTQVVALLNTARLTLNNPASKPAEIIAAIDLLGRKFGRFTTSAISGSDAEDLSTADSRAEQIGTFLSARYSADVQQAAVQGISSTGASSAAELLLMSMPTLSSEVRLQAIDVLLSTRAGSSALVEAISAGTVRSDLLDAGRRDKLISHKDVNISRAAAKAFGQTAVSSRSAVIASLRAAADGKGDPALGREVFRKRCSGCHRLEEHGFVVGPDLMALTNRDPQWLLTAILDPNRDVDARYLSWTAATVDGRTASGMIVEETATTIRLRESGGKEHVIPRSELEEFVSSQKSVMPEGLERDVTEPELRHVIAYLAGFESPPKSLPGNQPATVTSDDGGMLRLTAAVAEIRGNDITFEQSFGNVGYWHHQADQVRWQVDVATSGTFDVYLNASCADDSAGNRFRLSGLGNSMEGVMSGTGGWDRYRPVRLGTAKLSAGRHVVILQPSAPVKGALLDLKEVRLVPAGQSSQFETMTADDVPLPRYPPQIAPFLLDESQSRERRQQVIDQRPGMGPAIIGLLAAGIQPDDVEEEYRRIPWIWRVAIAVGKRNDGGEIRDVLEVSVPRPDQPLHDWQAVVIGGGLINGATLVDVWPQERMNEVLAGLPHVQAAWPEALTKAAQMADDETVRSGTRYDALRMVALRPTQEAMAHLLRYLKPETPRELQMGAVSGLVDIASEEVTPHLLSALEFLEGRNRQLALEGLLRSDGRAAALAKAIKSEIISISEKESTYFRQHSLQSIRRRFETLNPQR